MVQKNISFLQQTINNNKLPNFAQTLGALIQKWLSWEHTLLTWFPD